MDARLGLSKKALRTKTAAFPQKGNPSFPKDCVLLSRNLDGGYRMKMVCRSGGGSVLSVVLQKKAGQ